MEEEEGAVKMDKVELRRLPPAIICPQPNHLRYRAVELSVQDLRTLNAVTSYFQHRYNTVGSSCAVLRIAFETVEALPECSTYRSLSDISLERQAAKAPRRATTTPVLFPDCVLQDVEALHARILRDAHSTAAAVSGILRLAEQTWRRRDRMAIEVECAQAMLDLGLEHRHRTEAGFEAGWSGSSVGAGDELQVEEKV